MPMALLKLWQLLLILTIAIAECTQNKSYYTAAVYEHEPINSRSLSHQKNLDNNVIIYENTIREASKQGADIIVFPEYGLLQSLIAYRKTLNKTLPEVPDLKYIKNWNPCTNLVRTPQNDIVIRLSCAAKFSNIVVAFNYGSRRSCTASTDKSCPKDGFYLYNTEIIFDSDGSLLQVYHKGHLFGEPFLNPPSKFEYRTFHTRFGKFGIFTCYDIAFKEPQILVEKYKLDSIIYSTHWLDLYPTFTAVDVQSGFARENQVNVLAANCYQPRRGAIGSGIYSGKYGAVNYTMNTSNKPSLLIAKVPINPKDSSYKPQNFANNDTLNPSRHYMKSYPLDSFNFVDLVKDSGSLTVEQKTLKCFLNYTIRENFKPHLYQFGAFDGIFRLPQKSLAFQICLLIQKQKTSTQSIFGKFVMSSKSSAKFGNFPMVVTNYLKLAPSHEWVYQDGMIVAEKGITRPIQIVSLTGRNYSADPK